MALLRWHVEAGFVIDDLPYGLMRASDLDRHWDRLVLDDALRPRRWLGIAGRLVVRAVIGLGRCWLCLLRLELRLRGLLGRRFFRIGMTAVLEIEPPGFGDRDAPLPAPFVQSDDAAASEGDGARLERLAGRVVEVGAVSDPLENEKRCASLSVRSIPSVWLRRLRPGRLAKDDSCLDDRHPHGLLVHAERRGNL